MKIVLFYNFKGGVGKTTSTINSATFLSVYYNKKVGIIDADDYQWSTFNEYQDEKKEILKKYTEDHLRELIQEGKMCDYEVYESYVKDVPKLAKKLENDGLDILFVDLGNRTLKESAGVFEIADHIIVPYSDDKDEIKKSVIFTHLINKNYSNKNIKSLVSRIRKDRVESCDLIKVRNEKRFGNIAYKSNILARDHYKHKRSFFFPVNWKKESKDHNKGIISFVEEMLNEINLN